MHKSIVYNLPCVGEESREDFFHLKKLLSCAQSMDQKTAFVLSYDPSLSFQTEFCLKANRNVEIELVGLNTRDILPSGIFSEKSDFTKCISFCEAERKLSGVIGAVDHTGIVVPKSVSAQDWAETVNRLADNLALYDYPLSEEYDPNNSRWLFAIPFADDEATDHPAERIRQPKFEIVWDKAALEATVLQIDIETDMTSAQIKDAFPSCYSLPGLEEHICSVNVRSPWPGLSFVRLDLRFKRDRLINSWNSGRWIIDEGQRLFVNCHQSKLPQ